MAPSNDKTREELLAAARAIVPTLKNRAAECEQLRRVPDETIADLHDAGLCKILLAEAGHATRFGPDWPGQRCLAKTRKGTPCQNPAIKERSRCKLHGGKSTGPRTAEGKARAAAAHTKHGRRSRVHVAKVRYINAELRRITHELKRDGFIP
jgi:hypothetical protein